MKYANGVTMKAGRVSVRLVNGLAEYNLCGYVYKEFDENGNELLVLQPADLRKSPVFTAPADEVMYCRVQF